MRIVIILLFAAAGLFGCGANNSEDSVEVKRKPVEEVMKESEGMLLGIPGVQGFYQGLNDEEEDIIVVMVDSLTERIESEVPDSLGGYPVEIEVTGEVKPL